VRAADVRVQRARLLIVAVAITVCAVILWLSRSFSFYFDEWTFILPTDTGWAVYLQPHNEHPVMLTRLIYALLLNSVGMRSYVPYMAVLLALHAASVILLFELIRRRAGDLIGLSAALLLLVLGAAWENLLWAFQIAFVGSVACGLGALLVMDAKKPRMWLAMLLLFGSLMFSGIGLFFLLGAGVWIALTPSRRTDLLWLVPVGLALAAWYVAYGHTGAAPASSSLAGNLAAMPLYVAWGLGAAVAGLVGEGGLFGPALLILAIAAVAFTWRRRRPDAFAVGIMAALLAFYIVTGANRAQIGYQQSGSGRYVYEGAVFWLLLLADAARELPWRGTWRPALVACLFLACFNSGVLLYTYSVAKTAQMQREAADLQALAAERRDPCLNPNAVADPLVMPQVTNPAAYYRAVDRYGDPTAGMPAIRDADFDRAGNNLVKPGCVRPPESL
jgi:hypothetical protein